MATKKYARTTKSNPTVLTPRERRVVRLLVLTSETYSELAVKLGCTERTVKYHVTNILTKLGMKSRNELCASVLEMTCTEMMRRKGEKVSKTQSRRRASAHEMIFALLGEDDPIATAFQDDPKLKDYREAAK